MREILNAFAEQELYPEEIICDGKVHRFKVSADDARKSGWYVCFQNYTFKSGETYEVAVFGNFRTAEKFIYKNENVTTTAQDRKAIKEQIAAATRKSEEIRELLWDEVANEAEKTWNDLNFEGQSLYLDKKKITLKDQYGIRFDENGSIFIPMRDIEGRIWSYQQIRSDGTKLYLKGGKKTGNFHVIGEKLLESSETVRICEGFATGVAIYLSTEEPVIVAFDSGNLLSVSKNLKQAYNDKTFIICGDDDRWKKDEQGNPRPNVGKEKSEEAAKAVAGKSILPKFKNSDSCPTDFDDLLRLEGIDEVKKQLSLDVPRLALYALGHKEKDYFFTSTENQQIISITSFSEADFLRLMPLEYWEATYPSSSMSRVDWTKAKSNLMQACRLRGLFSGRKVRGTGAWIDDERIVVNMGNYLIVNGRKIGLGKIKSRFFYTLGPTLPPIAPPLNKDDCQHLINACMNFKWTKSDSGILLAGAMVIQRICGALPVRPHLWITGNAQVGKSTLLERLIKPMIGQTGLYVQGNSTEAGVRQELKADAVPVLFDEFETTGSKSDDRITSLIELMRVAWSDSSALIVKGSSSGNASHFIPRFCAIVSSIRTKLLDVADIRRFTVIELAPHGSDEEHWKRLKGYLGLITDDYGNRLFSRSINLLPTLLENFKKIRSILSQKANSGFGDQYGIILAGFSILVSDKPMTDEEVLALVDQIQLDEEKELLGRVDHEDCLEHLLTSTVNDGGIKLSILDLIDESFHEPGNKLKAKRLKMYGLAIQGDDLFIANEGHAELGRIFSQTKWKQWPRAFRRFEGARRHETNVSFRSTDEGKDFRGTLLPLKYVLKSK